MLQRLTHPKQAGTPFDLNFGRHLRRARLARNMSQEKLGNALGISFQQIQKYEKGVNRVSGGRLQQIANALDCSVTELIGDGRIRKGDNLATLGVTRQGHRLATAFLQLSPAIQAAFVEFVERMASEGA